MINSTRLKKFRLLKNLTQEELSELSSVSIRTIQRIEKGSSTGSMFTIDALSKALNVEISELQNIDKLNDEHFERSLTEVKLINLSAISLLIIPFGNLLVPLAFFLIGKGNADRVVGLTKKIFSFQILFTLGAIVLMVLLPLLLLSCFETLQSSKVPLFVPVYYLLAFVNILVILQTSVNLNKNKEILKSIPNLL